MPYNYKILKIFEDNALNISKLEVKLKNENRKYKYLPKLSFGGEKECFKKLKKL